MLTVKRVYDFPNAEIRVYTDRTTREFPKWCRSISVPRDRHYAAQALAALRSHRRQIAAAGR